MTLLIRLTVMGAFISLILVSGSYLPPFPSQFGAAITLMFQRVLIFDHWLPVRLAIQLWVWVAVVDFVVYGWRFVRWLKGWLMGEPRA